MKPLTFLILAFLSVSAVAQEPAELGAALGWKYDHEPGIFTRGGALVRWPSSLGTMPTLAEQQQIIAEYEAHLAAQAKEPDALAVIEAVLEDKALVTKAERDAKREELRTR